jgi:hypothetical protein
MQHEHIRTSDILYPIQCEEYVVEYRSYTISLLREVIPPSSIVTLEAPQINLLRKSIRIGINYEHTLVRDGGRNSSDSSFGIISVLGNRNQKYLVRVVNRTYLETCDIVIDYSIPNIFNVQSSRRFPKLTESHVYIAPCLYPIEWNLGNRTIDILTTFLNPDIPRRKVFLETCTNVSNCFGGKELCDLYKRTKILINVHQTDDHHTAEELRILPALQNGVIVVSEESPLSDMIPYGHLVIWAPYGSLLETAKNVLATYEQTFTNLFTPKNKAILANLHSSNLNRLSDHLRRNME